MRWLLGAFAVLFKSVFFLNLFEKVTFLNPEKKIKPNMFCPYLSLVLAFFSLCAPCKGPGRPAEQQRHCRTKGPAAKNIRETVKTVIRPSHYISQSVSQSVSQSISQSYLAQIQSYLGQIQSFEDISSHI